MANLLIRNLDDAANRSSWERGRPARLFCTGLAGILPACSAAPWDRRTPCGAAGLLRDESKTYPSMTPALPG